MAERDRNEGRLIFGGGGSSFRFRSKSQVSETENSETSMAPSLKPDREEISAVATRIDAPKPSNPPVIVPPIEISPPQKSEVNIEPTPAKNVAPAISVTKPDVQQLPQSQNSQPLKKHEEPSVVRVPEKQPAAKVTMSATHHLQQESLAKQHQLQQETSAKQQQQVSAKPSSPLQHASATIQKNNPQENTVITAPQVSKQEKRENITLEGAPPKPKALSPIVRSNTLPSGSTSPVPSTTSISSIEPDTNRFGFGDAVGSFFLSQIHSNSSSEENEGTDSESLVYGSGGGGSYMLSRQISNDFSVKNPANSTDALYRSKTEKHQGLSNKFDSGDFLMSREAFNTSTTANSTMSIAPVDAPPNSTDGLEIVAGNHGSIMAVKDMLISTFIKTKEKFTDDDLIEAIRSNQCDKIPDHISTDQVLAVISVENDWTAEEYDVVVKVLKSNRLRTVKDLRSVTDSGWDDIQVPLHAKNVLRMAVGNV